MNDSWGIKQKQRNNICCRGKLRAQATSDSIDHNNTTLALKLADTYQYFQDSPWCNEPQRLYRILAVRYPEARFVLTFRESDPWWSSVVRSTTACQEQDGDPKTDASALVGDAKLQRYADILNAKSVSREDMTAGL